MKKDSKLLRSFDRFFQTDTAYLAYSGFWASLSKVISTLLFLILSTIYARYLTKDIYGNYRFVMSVISIGYIFSLSGIYTSFFRTAAREDKGVFRQGMLLRFYTSILISIFGLVTSLYFIFTKNYVIALSIFIAGLLAPLQKGTGGYTGWLALNKQFHSKAFIIIIEHVVFTCAMTLAVLGIYVYGLPLSMAVPLLIATSFLGHGIPKSIYFIRTLRSIPNRKKKENQSIIKFGLHLSASRILQTIAARLDSILLYLLLGPISLAIYSFAIALPEQLRNYITTSNEAIEAKIYTKRGADLRHLPTKLWKSSIIILLIVLLYIVTAPLIFKIFFPRYISSVPLSQLYALSILFTPVTYLNSALIATKKIKRIYVHKIISPAAQIIIFALFIPFWGALGAVLGRIIGRFINALLLFTIYRLDGSSFLKK